MGNNSGRITDLQTVIEFPNAETWLRDAKLMNSDSNAKGKRIALEQFDEFLRDDLDGLDLELVDNTVLFEFSKWLAHERGLAHGTVEGRWYDVRMYLNKVFDDDVGWDEDDSTGTEWDEYILDWLETGSEAVKQTDRDVHWLHLDTIAELIEGAKNFKNEMCIRLLWSTGCRPSEIARMKVRRVNRDMRAITVKSSKIEDPEKELYERDVFYSRSMREHMREWLDYGGRDAYSHAGESPFLMVGYNTPSVQARQVNNIVKMAADEAEIQSDAIQRADGVSVNRITAKTLRHSFAVHAIRGKERTGTPAMDLERLRRIMGHESIESTRYYLRFRTEELRDAFDRSHPSV